VEPDAVELRVLGCLIEKQRTTPDAYPLSLNALRLACNQLTNRDPVVEYDEATIRDALARLARRRWVRLASGHGSRASKYRHLIDEALGLKPDAIALLAVLLLRGPQTPGELNQRAARLHPFDGLPAVEETLRHLEDRGLAAALARRPGQKEVRYVQRLGEQSQTAEVPDVGAPVVTAAATSPPPPAPPAPDPARDERIEALEREVAELRREVEELRVWLES